MARPEKLDETALAALVDQQLADALDNDSVLDKTRRLAIEYREGKMSEMPTDVGKSKVVSHDVADVIGWIAPSLARVFLASEHVGTYEPEKEADREYARQATDYVNYVLMRECGGYGVISTAIDDGLLLGNGIVKHWWDDTREEKAESFTGLDEMALTALLSDPQIEQESLDIAQRLDEAGVPVFDVKAKRIVSPGRLCVEAVPPEDFLIEKAAKALDEKSTRFCAHRYTATRSELVKRGYPKERVYELSISDDNVLERVDRDRQWPGAGPDPSTELLDVYECYVQCDYDGDGIAELRKVVMVGGRGKRNILENVEFGEDLPFTDIVPSPVSHRWRGRSMYDEGKEVQDVKTVVMRKTLDSLYLAIEPRETIDTTKLEDGALDEALDRAPGAAVRVKGEKAITPLVTPFVGKEALPILNYMDEVLEKRTGVSRASMALDPEALQNQTATAVQAGQAAAMSKVELYARNIAENGMARLFQKLLRLVVRHQDRPRMILLRDKFVEMNPSAWNAEMKVSVNTGLGAGTRDRDLQTLIGITGKMEQAMQMMGPVNPLTDLALYAGALRKMVEVSGIKNADAYFKEISPEELQAFAAKMSQPKPDPKAMEAQAKLQLEQAKAQADTQLAQQRAAAEVQLQRDKAQADLSAQREAGLLKLDIMREESAAKLQLAVEEAKVRAQLRREEMMLEAELTQRANEMNAAVAASRPPDTNINSQAG